MKLVPRPNAEEALGEEEGEALKGISIEDAAGTAAGIETARDNLIGISVDFLRGF
jgi:hypothetical protein